jgi:hypothetical protein
VKATDYVGQASRRYRFEIMPTRGDSGARNAKRRHADLSDEASGVSDDGAKSDTPSGANWSCHYRVIHTGSFGGFEAGRTILQNQASLW